MLTWTRRDWCSCCGWPGIGAKAIWWSRCNRKSATHEALLWREIARSVEPMGETEEGSK
jgi:hypothetical protein